MPIVSDFYRYVVGVDTHAATHTYSIIDAHTARLLDTATFPTHNQGLSRAITWIARRTDGNITDTLISIEGTGSYGARLTRSLLHIGYRVVDAPSPKRSRGKSKNDTIDAHKAATVMLAQDTDSLADARTGDLHECLKTVLATRNRLASDKTRAFNAMTALLREHDLGIDARKKPNLTTVRAITKWRPRNEPRAVGIAREEVVRLAKHVVDLHALMKANEELLRSLVTEHAPVLLNQPGMGPVNTAVILNAWSFHGRLKSEAAWAALAGVAPIEIASGSSSHHRLSRGGDRQLNRAFHSIARTNAIFDEETRSYIARRTAEGKSVRSIRRALKRHIARRVYRLLNQPGNLVLAA